jgi:hypothetical protein
MLHILNTQWMNPGSATSWYTIQLPRKYILSIRVQYTCITICQSWPLYVHCSSGVVGPATANAPSNHASSETSAIDEAALLRGEICCKSRNVPAIAGCSNEPGLRKKQQTSKAWMDDPKTAAAWLLDLRREHCFGNVENINNFSFILIKE